MRVLRLKLGENLGAVGPFQKWLLLDALSELLGVRVDGLPRSRCHVPRYLAPVLAEEAYSLQEAHVLLVSPVALAAPALVLNFHTVAALFTEGLLLVLGPGLQVAAAHLLLFRH